MSVAPSSASSPTSPVSRPLPRPPALRALRPAVVATAACLALSACTAHMDMTIRSQGSYDVALEMRDTSGTVFPKGKAPDCSAYSDPTALGVPAGTTVTWDDPDTVAKGVSASGYAQDSRGVSWWSRSRVWLTAGLALLGGALAAAILRRRSRGHAPRKAAQGRH